MNDLEYQRQTTKAEQQEGDVGIGDQVEQFFKEIGVVVVHGSIRRFQSHGTQAATIVRHLNGAAAGLLQHVGEAYCHEVDDVQLNCLSLVHGGGVADGALCPIRIAAALFRDTTDGGYGVVH